MSMNMKQLKYVLVLSEQGSFSKAAEALNISQPSLSQYIKKIEQQTGAELFVRTNGNVRLTDAGLAYVDAGRKILALEREMSGRLFDISEHKTGTITVGISPYRSVHMIPEVLRRFDKLYPGIKLIIREKSGASLIEAAANGDFDVCIIALPVDERLFNFETVQKEEVVIAVKAGTSLHGLLGKNAVLMKDRRFPAVDLTLAQDRDFAVLNEFMLMRKVTERLLNMYDVRIREKIEVSSNEALLSIVKSGVCASFIPSGLVDSQDGEISFFSIKQDFDFRTVGAIWRKDQYISKPVSDLIEIFKAL